MWGMTSLSEDVLLLALDDEKGHVGMGVSTTLDTALAGAQLLDLAMAKRITIEDKRVIPLDGPPLDDPVLDAALRRILEQDEHKKAEKIIPKLTKGLRKRLLAQLVDKRIVRADEHRVFFIPKNRYPEINGAVEDELRRRLRDAILLERTPDERTAALAAVIQAAGLESLIMNREERKASKQRLKALAEREALSPAIRHAIAWVNASAMG
jgi:hypothetical protein